MRITDYYELFKPYSAEDICIELQNNSEYSYAEATKFVESLGYTVKDGGNVSYDNVFDDWRGFVNIELPNEK